VLLFGSCSGEPPRWIHLARDHRSALPPPGWGAAEGISVSTETEDGERVVWLEAPVANDAWQEAAADQWLAPAPLCRAATSQRGDRALLRSGDTTYATRMAKKNADTLDGLEPGDFRADLRSVAVRHAPASAPPTDVTLALGVEPGRDVDGVQRIELGAWTGEGLLVWSNVDEEVPCDVPTGSVLRFAVVAAALRNTDAGSNGTLRVLLDGELLWEQSAPLTGTELVHHEGPVPVGSSGRRGARLRFELGGPPAIAAFFAPIVAPAVARAIAAPDPRPDILLFLADTFRADNMRTYGGRHDLTPTLDALAAESVVFERAWSPAPWTLPSQAAMLTGQLPPQIVAQADTGSLPDEVLTIAELLASVGYRTAAVTDSGLVSRHTGFDQGFELFDERLRPLEETEHAVDALLDADDGRPLFLFVQTYRVHQPYHVSDATRERHGERLRIPPGDEKPERDPADAPRTREELVALVLQNVQNLQARYRGGVLDLDTWFARFHQKLVTRDFYSGGYLVFTSDHGEGFNEHGVTRHVGGLWEELIRIPLFIHGRNLAPRTVPHAAMLTDLAPTVAELVGLPVHAEWEGTSLLSLAEDRTLFSFERVDVGTGDMALIDGDRKLLTPATIDSLEAGNAGRAFDLAADPGELHDLFGTDRWPSDLVRRSIPEVRRVLEPRYDPAESTFGGDAAQALEVLGYVDGDE
jgi:arylsulfatase A-like enzyme